LRRIENIIIHCSDSLWGCAREIRQWHLKRGWSDIGYHFVILNGKPTFSHSKNQLIVPALDGAIECGRYLDDDIYIAGREQGAHALGYNRDSIGLCLIGVDDFTEKEMASLHRLTSDLMMLYQIPVNKVKGHCETKSGREQGKTCPNIDMDSVRWTLKRLEGNRCSTKS